MKILIDIGHPAHVHYYKNFIRIMESKGHSFFVTARDRECVKELLNYEDINFVSRGKGAKSTTGRIYYLTKATMLILLYSLRFKPDILLGHGSIYAALAAMMIGKPCVLTSDTDSTKVHKQLIKIISVLLSPSCFRYKYGVKHILFDGFMEMMYLHPNYFNTNRDLIENYLPNNSKKNVLMRFVSWDAYHDKNISGLPNDLKKKLVETLEPHCNIFISSENKMDNYLEKHRIKIPPYLMHSFINCMDMFIGESATMTSEAALLGVPAIYYDCYGRGYTDEEEKYGLVYNYRCTDGLIEQATKLSLSPNLKKSKFRNLKRLLKNKIDPTAFLVWFIECFPDSKYKMWRSAKTQYKFK